MRETAMTTFWKTLLVAAATSAACSTASANMIFTFSANGMSESIAQQGTAVFDFADPSHLAVTLTNNVNPTQFLISELDGLDFTLGGSATGINLDSVSVASGNVVNCTGAVSAPCPAGTGSDPFGWSASGAGSSFSFGAGTVGSTHPFHIINSN